MTADDFRRIALGMRDAVEGAHMGHPDFRAHGKIFASLHHDMQHGMVKLAPGDQRELVAAHPEAFAPESGAWGRQGCTRVTLSGLDEETLGGAMTLARRNVPDGGHRASARPAGGRRREGRGRR
jgi:hypothetical protein